MRLIDADALHEALMTKQKWVVRCGDKHNEGYTYDQVHFAIDEAPTIEAVSIDDYRSMENTCYKLQKALYEMADRKTENSSEIPNNCETCKHNKLEWYSEICDSCCGNNNHYEPKTEPQTIRCPKCGRTDYIRDMEKDMGIKGSCYKYKCINCNTYIKDEQTEDEILREQCRAFMGIVEQTERSE